MTTGHEEGRFHAGPAAASSRITVLIADPDPAYTLQLTQTLTEARLGIEMLGVAATQEDLWERVREHRPAVVLVAAPLIQGNPGLIRQILETGVQKVVLLVGDMADPTLRQLQQPGVQLLFRYAAGETLVEAIRTLPQSAGQAPAEAFLPVQGPTFPQVLTIHGPAGGVGKTLVALYLAYLYAGKGYSTILVDLSQYGSVAPWLRIPRGNSGVTGLLAALREGEADDERIRSTLVPAPGREEGFHLALSSGPAKMDQIRTADVEKLIRYLSGIAQIVVVDTSSELTERVLGAMLASTRLLLTISPQFVTGWQTLELLEILRSVYINRDRLGLVLTRVRGGARYGLGEYQEILNLPLLGTIPESADLQAAADKGGPPDVQRNGRGPLALRQLAHQVVPIFTPKELRSPWPWRR